MKIALAKDVEEYLTEQLRSGACADASDLVNNVLRSIRDQQFKVFEVSPALESWLLEAADKPATPLSDADFEGIRSRVKSRVQLPGS
jgi:Arc/MetJ-type ribon-helix-helix transcriptional regulator